MNKKTKFWFINFAIVGYALIQIPDVLISLYDLLQGNSTFGNVQKVKKNKIESRKLSANLFTRDATEIKDKTLKQFGRNGKFIKSQVSDDHQKFIGENNVTLSEQLQLLHKRIDKIEKTCLRI